MSDKKKPNHPNHGYIGPGFPHTTSQDGKPIEGFFAVRLRLGLQATTAMRSTLFPCEQCYQESAAVMDNETHRYWCYTCAANALEAGRPLTGNRPLTDYTPLDSARAITYSHKISTRRAPHD